MVKKVPPYLRHTKPPYTIHVYSAVLAQRSDMVAWYKPPVVQRVDPIVQVPEIEDAPDDAMTDEEFRRMAAEQERIAALKAAQKGDGPIEARKGVKEVDYSQDDNFVYDTDPDNAMSEADFDRIKEPEIAVGPASPVDHDEVSVNAPVEGTPAGNAAKRHGQPTRKKAAVDEFAGVAPPSPKKPPLFGDKFAKAARTY